jgi:hypothetical protein
MCDSCHVSFTAGQANTLVARDQNGYIFNTWYNSNRSAENTAAAQYIYDTGDGYMRKKDLANVRAEINQGTFNGTVSCNLTGANSADLVYALIADNDFFRIRAGGTASNAGYAEIATADDGAEPIYVRQYTGVFGSLTRSATLLSDIGNTSFPGILYANGLSITGLITMYNPNGTNYNEGIRIPAASSGWSGINIGCDTSGAGTIAGQWNLVRYPSAQNSKFAIRNSGGADVLTLGTDNTAVFASTVTAPEVSISSKYKISYDSTDGSLSFSYIG